MVVMKKVLDVNGDSVGSNTSLKRNRVNASEELHFVIRNEAIYESWEVKRAGAENLGRELPHIPLAVGVGRSGPSQTTPAVPVGALSTHIP